MPEIDLGGPKFEPENGPNAQGLDADDLQALKDEFSDAPRIDLESRPDTNIYGTHGEVRPQDSISRMAEEVADNVPTPHADPPQPGGPDFFARPDPSLRGELGRPYESSTPPAADAPRPPQQGLTAEDLDRLKAMEEEVERHGHIRTETEIMQQVRDYEPPDPVLSKKPETFTDRQTRDAIERIDAEIEHPTPLDIDKVANFETFPPLPDEPASPGARGSRPQGLSREDLAALRAMEADAVSLPPVSGAENVEALRTTLGEGIDLEAPGDPNLLMEQETQALRDSHRFFEPSPMMLAAGAAAVIAFLALLGLLYGRSGGPAAAPGTPGGTSIAAAPGAPKAAAGAAVWPGCTAPAVPAGAADAIPANERWLVSVYCIGDHYFPVEQFEFKLSADCTRPGITGGMTRLVTKSGNPAVAIDSTAFTLPSPGACGYMLFEEAKAHADAVNSRAPNGFPARTALYREFQAKAGTGGR